MMKKNNKRKEKRGKDQPVIKRLWARTHKLSAHTTEEEEWQSDMPNIKLSRAFVIVLILHIVAVGGILAFELFKQEPEMAQKKPSESYPPASTTQERAVTPGGLLPTGEAAHIGLKTYRVRSGESIQDVALLHNVSVADLERINDLNRSGQGLFAGAVIHIPSRQIRASTPQEIADIHRNRQNHVIQPNNRPHGGNSVNVGYPNRVVSPPQLQQAPPVGIGHTPTPESVPIPGGSPTPIDAPEMVRPHRVVEPEPAQRQAIVEPAPTERVVHYQPSPEPAPVAQPPAPPAAKVHVVKQGDNPYRIAKTYGVNMTTLLKHNGISDPTNLKIGTQLRIP